MTPRENIQLLISLIEQEPGSQINLNKFNSDCGTIHCNLGLAGTHEHFKAQGLVMGWHGKKPRQVLVLTLNGSSPINETETLNAMFGPQSWERCFAPAGLGLWDIDLLLGSHKDLALARLNKQLEQLP
jgi:hypothetical protein